MSVSPMLAHSFSKHGHKIKFPAYVQPKLDGHRCLTSDGALWTRTGKKVTSLPLIQAAVSVLPPLDGELYLHGEDFGKLSGALRSKEPAPGHERIEFHVYDLPGAGTYAERLVALMRLNLPPGLVWVTTKLVHDANELATAHDNFVAEGYEGAMVRNAAGLYVAGRSYDLQKVKEFEDAEFTVTGVESGQGKLLGCAIFVCAAGEHAFRVKLKGTHESLKSYLESPERAIGRSLTVRFQGLTAGNKVPRFPVGLRFREDV